MERDGPVKVELLGGQELDHDVGRVALGGRRRAEDEHKRLGREDQPPGRRREEKAHLAGGSDADRANRRFITRVLGSPRATMSLITHLTSLTDRKSVV